MIGDVIRYGQNAHGGRNVGVTGPTGVILVPSSDAAEDELAQSTALTISRTLLGEVALEFRTNAERNALVHLTQQNARCEEIIATLRAELEAERRPRQRFNGPVLLRPHRPGDWKGPVWLLDPAKQEAGFGLLFASLQALRSSHPELWVLSADANGVLLAAPPSAAEVG
jgi:hypothetical protein